MDKEFDQLFSDVSHRRSRAEIWNDFIHMSSLAIANSCDFQRSREDSYLSIVKKYNRDELNKLVAMFARTVCALDDNREQDFLGQLFMEYKLGDVKRGQYFTPYNIADMMSRISAIGQSRRLYETVGDPTAGSGVMLIASINQVLRVGGNPRTDIFVVAEELDPYIGMMCYVQLSLLGGAGYVVVHDSLSNPLTGNVLFPPEGAWCTPMFYHPVWKWRRLMGGK